ncbi:MAG: class I SAM-dependent methyltransferase [Actinomycetota bacterium]|nr:class I SAM-dependent methyltransferase [Actinomycetota bacterium]
MSSRRTSEGLGSEEAIWQDVEFGAYRADLPLWAELATERDGAVVELGAGSGRVALHLAQRGVEVIAIERDAGMIEALQARAQGWPVLPLHGDLARPEGAWLDAASPAALAIAPLHVIQQLEPGDRPGLLSALAGALAGGTLLAVALVDESSLAPGGVEDGPEPPDMREVDGFLYSSEALWVQVGDDLLTVRRLRERVSPSGEIERGVHDDLLARLTPDRLEQEGSEAGLRAAGRRAITSGRTEADSTAVILEVR